MLLAIYIGRSAEAVFSHTGHSGIKLQSLMETAMKHRRIIVPASLQNTVLEQLHINHMGIERTRLLAHDSTYWVNINANIESKIKNCPICLDFQATQFMDKTMSHEIPGWLWESL